MSDQQDSGQFEHSTETSRKIELEDGGSYSQYLLHSKTEIIFVLRALQQKGAMITVYFDHAKSFLLTSIVQLSSDNQYVYFDYGSNEEMNGKALLTDKLVFTTTLDKVKIQFSLTNLDKVAIDGRPAFRGLIPETLLRLQRREYYRLETPIASPLKCLVPLLQADGATKYLEATVLDISGGGIGVAVASDSQEFKRDNVFVNCKLNLPDEGELIATLLVRNSFQVTTKTGSNYLRVGFEYVNLPGTRLSMIQRYITRIERERKARLSGMI
jgi:c-di-GMP-binding flagellar brake protein YcgR